MKCLANGKKNKQYDTRIRTFALTLHFYSPRGYRYVRSVFKNTLPSISTIRKWYSVIDGTPGFSTEAFAALKLKASEANQNGNEILGCIILDEMAIRKHEEYDAHNHKKIGQVNFGTNIVDKETEFAKDALVYMVTGINENFKIPVAYFLISGLKANEKAALTKEVILLTSKTGVKVVGMTFDGLKSNFAMARNMGAAIEKNKPYITNPHSDDKIYIFPDACHMLKLVRNRLAKNTKLYDANNDCIEWKYVIELEKYQRENKINLGNKINKTHVQWEKKKMSVRIACETLSNSTADSFDFLRLKGVEEFQESEPTANFFRRFNNVFDTLNSMHENAKGFKRPITPETKNEYFQYFDESISYIRGVKSSLNGKSILKTTAKTPFIGFIVDMQNFRSFYLEYVESSILSQVLTFRFSQDHLELLFACIRQMVSA